MLTQYEAERQAALSRPEALSEIALPVKVYDPIDLYCTLAREFHWSDREMDEMDYVRFFSYVDRLGKQRQREKEERDNGPSTAPIVDADQQAMMERLAPTPAMYTGETVVYGG